MLIENTLSQEAFYGDCKFTQLRIILSLLLIGSPSYYKLANILRLITQLQFNHVTCILEVVTTLDCALSGLTGPLVASPDLSYWLLSVISCQILAKSHKKSWWSHNWLFGSHLPTPDYVSPLWHVISSIPGPFKAKKNRFFDVSDCLTTLTARHDRPTCQDFPIFYGQQQQPRQTDRLITLPLAHACRVITDNYIPLLRCC